MKWMILSAICCAVGVVATAAEAQLTAGTHRVVFEFVSAGGEQMEAVLNNIENSMKALGPNSEVILIAHGPGLGLLVKTNTATAKRIESLIEKKVVFAACENTLKRKNIYRGDLLPRVITVDSGVAEVVRRQEARWAYIKSGH
jgi:intracellular sulfur oxidation DsrE/DsrF family protein